MVPNTSESAERLFFLERSGYSKNKYKPKLDTKCLNVVLSTADVR